MYYAPRLRPEEARRRRVDPFTLAVQAKKEQWYSRVKLSVKQLDLIIWLAAGALAVVVLLIALEAAGIFKL